MTFKPIIIKYTLVVFFALCLFNITYEDKYKMRWDKKKEIVEKMEVLQADLEEYLQLWKVSDGGTTGRAIGSMIVNNKHR